MKTIYYAIERQMDIPDDMKDEEVEKLMDKMSENNDLVWDHNPGLFYEKE